jgi:DNA ligase 1
VIEGGFVHYEKLYKRTTTGAIQVWWQEREGGKYRTHSGQKDGKIVTSEWTIAKPKNVGRSNETSQDQQAEAEIEANYTLKKKGGYHVTVGAVDTARFSPMLAKVYGDYKDNVAAEFARGVHVQPKLDGIRCIARADGLWSRQGNPIVAVPHIFEALKSQLECGLVLDGELYNHDYREDFPALVSLIKKQKPSVKDLEASRAVEYWVYDSPGDGMIRDRLMRVVNAADQVGGPVVRVPTHDASSFEDLDELHEKYIGDGFEGSMIRLNGPYEQKRSNKLLKRKEWMDEEFEVLDIQEGEGNRSGMAGNVIVRLPNGKEGSANVKGNREYCREVLADRKALLGKKVTVEFFGYTPDGKLRFPRTKMFHKETRW